MARFQLLAAFVVGANRYRAGSFLCDGTSCQAGDKIWTGLNSGTYSPHMLPLDAGANAIKAASVKYSATTPKVTIDGVDSVDV
jgi:hypothetical protein